MNDANLLETFWEAYQETSRDLGGSPTLREAFVFGVHSLLVTLQHCRETRDPYLLQEVVRRLEAELPADPAFARWSLDIPPHLFQPGRPGVN